MGLKAALTLCTAVVAAVTAAMQWRRRGRPARVPLALVMASAAVWAVAELLGEPMQRVPIRTRQVLQALSDAVLVVDDAGIVVEVNEAALELVGVSRARILGSPWTSFIDRDILSTLDEDGRTVVHLRDGRHLDVRVTPVDGRGRQVGSVLVARDVTELERLRAELAEQALRDPLTGLHNRRRLSTVIDGLASRPPERLVAVMLDVDHFKAVNDTYGHAVGDKVLVAVAEELRRSVRSGDVVARVGGEEFALLLPGARVDDVVRRVEELRARCAGITVPEAPGLHITVSAGVAALDPTSPDVRGLLDVADRGVYQAKADGRDRLVVAVA